MPVDPRHASVALIGAGDFIGTAIAKRFAAEGYLVVAGRRSAGKLSPLVAAIEADGGRCIGRALDARNEAEVSAFMAAAEAAAPIEVCSTWSRQLAPRRAMDAAGAAAAYGALATVRREPSRLEPAA